MKSKIIYLLILIISLPFLSQGQTNPLDDMIKMYDGQEGFYFLDLKTNLMGSKDEGTKSYDKVVNLKMISFDETENGAYKSSNLYHQFFSKVDKTQYRGLVDIKSSGDNVEMMIKKDGERVEQVIIALQEETSMTIIAASGNFDLKDLAHFKDIRQCHGMQLLQELCEE